MKMITLKCSVFVDIYVDTDQDVKELLELSKDDNLNYVFDKLSQLDIKVVDTNLEHIDYDCYITDQGVEVDEVDDVDSVF